MTIILDILVFVLVLGSIILIHEGGHFFFARRVNILCREFAFGMGPILAKKKKGETLYSLRAFPIGGFCAIAGEELENDPIIDGQSYGLEIENGIVKKIYIDSKNQTFSEITHFKISRHDLFDQNQTGNLFIETEENNQYFTYPVDAQAMFMMEKQEFQIAPYNRTIQSKRKRDRAMVIFGGPLMNFLLALIVFFLAGLIGGFPDQSSNYLSDILEDTPAFSAGLQENDQIVSMQSSNLFIAVQSWEDVQQFMTDYSNLYPDNSIQVRYMRNNAFYTTTIQPRISIYSIGLVSDYTANDVIVGSIADKSIAYLAGLREGQKITFVNDTPVTTWKQVYDAFVANTAGEEVSFQVEGSSDEIIVKPYSKEVMDSQLTLTGDTIPLAKMAIGISPESSFDFFESFAYSGRMTVSAFGLIFNTLRLLFTSDEIGIKNLGGVVAIFSLTSDVAKNGFVSILNWIGLLSVNVGLLNLLPIPALDGGRLIFLGYEAITKKKPNQKVETALITATMLLLFAFMIYITFNDIINLFGVR
ncbi:MAG: RIP metalloprotease RseP [Bacilli bacterium]|jgi:regulator of sigma E protease|nr:RIP metalloprotease RseP [Bacilli bacterium]MDY0063957.1 RIP metalloprotease RseP [Bacilli bacterium]